MRKILGNFAHPGRQPIDKKAAFSDRLNELCDEDGIPPKGKNRQKLVGERFSVSQKGARKWLEGEGFPDMEKCLEIAEEFNVTVEWLLTGRGPKRVARAPMPVFTHEEVAAARKIAEIVSVYAEK